MSIAKKATSQQTAAPSSLYADHQVNDAIRAQLLDFEEGRMLFDEHKLDTEIDLVRFDIAIPENATDRVHQAALVAVQVLGAEIGRFKLLTFGTVELQQILMVDHRVGAGDQFVALVEFLKMKAHAVAVTNQFEVVEQLSTVELVGEIDQIEVDRGERRFVGRTAAALGRVHSFELLVLQ